MCVLQICKYISYLVERIHNSHTNTLIVEVFRVQQFKLNQIVFEYSKNPTNHGLRTPNEGINQRNLTFWADVADKICFGRTYKFWIGI